MGIPKNTFLTKQRSDDAAETMELAAKRASKSGDLTKQKRDEIRKNKPEATYATTLGKGKLGEIKVSGYGDTGDQYFPYNSKDLDKDLIATKAEKSAQKQGATSQGAAKASREAVRNYEGAQENQQEYGMKKGGKVSSASTRADGIAQRGKTKGRMC
jgi:hypothetical protein